MKQSSAYRVRLRVVGAIVAPIFLLCALPTAAHNDGIETALQRAQDVGAYAFAANLHQHLVPKAEAVKPGTSGTTLAFQIAGHIQSSSRARLRLAPLTPNDPTSPIEGPVEVVLFEGQTYARKAGAAWQRMNASSLPFGTEESDYMALLNAAQGVQQAGEETINGELYTRYFFLLSGQEYANYLRRELANWGGPGWEVMAQVPDIYRTMTGEGTLWVRQADGLPYLERLELTFPDADPQFLLRLTVEAQFSNYGQFPDPPILPPVVGDTALAAWDWPSVPRLPEPGTAPSLRRADPTPFLVLIPLGSLIGLALLIHRRPRILYTALTFFVCFTMTTQPVLAAVAAPKPLPADEAATFEEVLSAPVADPLAAQGLAPHQAPVPAPALSGSSTITDTDRDGLTNQMESLLGTDPDESDSDRDGLSDQYEATFKVTVGGEDWYLNPLEPDTNHDGIPDEDEIITPSDPDSTRTPDLDTDGNNVPNIWDEDNDGDGVPDSLDVSPFTQSPNLFWENGPFHLVVEQYDTGPARPVYVIVQLRPFYENSLRYGLSTFNWPVDSKGQIQDSITTGGLAEQDLILAPMLEITPDEGSLPPDVSDLDHYQMTLSSGKIYVPLQTLSDGGREVGFQAKLFFPASTPSWASASDDRRSLGGNVRLVWVVTTEDDETGDRSIVARYNGALDSAYFVTGVVAEEQYGAEVALIYDDTSYETEGSEKWQDPAPVLKALFGLESTYLVSGTMSLNTLTDTLQTTWNLTTTEVNLQNFAHVDEALAATTMTTTKQVLSSYPDVGSAGLDVGILFLLEQTVAMSNLDSLLPGTAFANQRVNLNLSESVGSVTERGMKLQWYNTVSQESLGAGAIVGVINRYEDDWDDEEDQQAQANLKLVLAGWAHGQTIAVDISGTPIYYPSLPTWQVPEQLDWTEKGWDGLERIIKQWKRNPDTGALTISARAKIAIGISFSILKIVTEQNGGKINVGNLEITSEWLTRIEKIYSAYDDVTKIWKLKPYKSLFGTPSKMKTRTKVLGAIGLVLELAIIWTTFQILTTDVATNSPQFRYALAMAMAQTILAVAMFALMFTGIGLIIIAIFSVLEAVLRLFGVKLEDEIIAWIASLFYTYEQATFIPEEDGVQFGGMSVEAPNGLRPRAQVYYVIPFTVTIKNNRTGTRADIEDSYYRMRLDGECPEQYDQCARARRPYLLTGWLDPDCEWSEESMGTFPNNWTQYTQECVHRATLDVEFREPDQDVPIRVEYTDSYQLFIKECVQDDCALTSITGGGKAHNLGISYFDVLPATLYELLNWWEEPPWYGNITGAADSYFMADVDGDGIYNWLEGQYDVNPELWDTDGDLLSDNYEIDLYSRQNRVYCDPTRSDTDGDGLNDRAELRFGSNPAVADTDGDGLNDKQEYDGWLYTVSTAADGTITTRAFPDPNLANRDGDNLTDDHEAVQQTNPNGFNPNVQVEKTASSAAEREDWPPILTAGWSVTYSLDYIYHANTPYPVEDMVFTDALPSPLVFDSAVSTTDELTLTHASPDALAWSAGTLLSGTSRSFSMTLTAHVPSTFTTQSIQVTNTVTSTGLYAGAPISAASRAPAVIDNDDPSSQVNMPAAGDFIRGSSYVLGGAASDPTSWPMTMEVRIWRSGYDSGWGTASGADRWAYTWDPVPDPPSGDGTYTAACRATDAVGHVETPGPGITFTVDNTGPTATITTPNDGALISVTATSYFTGWDIVGGEPIIIPRDHVYTITGTADDTVSGADRVSGVDEIYFFPDASESYALTYDITDTNTAAWTYTWYLGGWGFEGRYQMQVRAGDTAGNVGDPSPTTTVIVDNFAPFVSFSQHTFNDPDAGFFTGTTIITGTAYDPPDVFLKMRGGDDEVAGVAQVEYRIDRLIQPTQTQELLQDWTAATLDDFGAQTTTFTITWTPPADDFYVLSLRGRDRAGNLGPLSANDELRYFRHGGTFPMIDEWTIFADVTAPTATITTPVASQTVPYAVFYVEGLVDDGPLGTVEQVEVSLDGGLTWQEPVARASVIQVEAGLYRWLYTWEITEDGIYTLTARATDEWGHLGTASTPFTVTVDTTGPRADISDPSQGQVISGTTYLVQGKARSATGTSVITVSVVVDENYGAPEDATIIGSGNRVSWVYTWTLPSTDGAHRLEAYAADDTPMWQTDTLPITVTVDTRAPLLTMINPPSSDWSGIISGTSYVISGTVNDATMGTGSGISAVRVQTDTGQAWQAATVFSSGLSSNWAYTWTLPQEDWVTHTLYVRAVDDAGNLTATQLLPDPMVTTRTDVVVDTVLPSNPITFTANISTHYRYTDTLTPNPVVTWTGAYDGGGIASYLVRWQETATWEPTTANSTQAPAFTPPEMFLHLRTVDNAGNRSVQARHGPFRLDSEEPPTQPVLDGFLTEAENEWLSGERLGHDTRPDTGAQTFYTTWDEEHLYFAWDGAVWNTDGDAFIYLDVDPGFTSQGVTATWDYSGTHTLPPADPMEIPGYAFTADYLLYIEDSDTWGIRRCMSSTLSWDPVTATVTTTVLFGGDQVEVRLLKADVGMDTGCAQELSLLAFAQEEMTGTLASAFPTTNDLTGDLTDYFYWSNPCLGAPPAQDQPQAVSLVLEGMAAPAGAVGQSDPVTYTFTYSNAGLVAAEGVARVWLTLPTDLNATCSDISGDYNTGLGIQTVGDTCIVPVSQGNGSYELPASYIGTLTLTGQVDAVASTGYLTVTGVISHDITAELHTQDNAAAPSVDVDATPPQPAFDSEAMQSLFTGYAPGGTVYVGPNMQVLGAAYDNRSGIAEVDADLDDGQGWQDASGATLWSHTGPTGTADGVNLTLRTRASDGVGNQSDVITLSVVMDSVSPQSSIVTPTNGSSVSVEETVLITGTATDARSGVAYVEVGMGSGTVWHRATLVGTTWSVEWEVEEAGVYTLTVRSTDAVGNLESPGSPVVVRAGEPTAVDLASFTASDHHDRVLLEWETATEVNIVGFNLQRSGASAGPYSQINPAMIPAWSPGSNIGAVYAYADTTVASGTYWYRLEILKTGGSRLSDSIQVTHRPNWLYLPLVCRRS